MLELAGEDVGPDEELGMRMCAEAGALLDAVLIDDAERTVRLELRVIVGCE